MKKLALLVMMLANTMFANAQNYDTLYIADIPNHGAVFDYCASEYDGVIIYGLPDWNCEWTVNGEHFNGNSIVVLNTEYSYYITYIGGGNRNFDVIFHPSYITNPFTESMIWKRQGETIRLSIPEDYDFDLEWEWSNGSTDYGIDVADDGIYSVTFTSIYGCELEQSTFPIEVRDNVEIYRSGVDPATNKNRVLWQTTPEQAEYISNVKVERDGMVVGTVPYTDGQFLDNIGSENAARIYKITAIDTDGNECPIPSYQFGTFNTIISPDIANPSLMNFTWEDPFIEEGSLYSIAAYRIGRFNESTGEFVAIDQLSAQVHIGKYNMDLFEGDYGIVAAVFNDAKNRDYEELAFSNRSDSGIVGIGEQDNETFGIYPNPAKGRFTVEGSGTMTVTNTLGQTILTREIDGKETVELPQGLYFVKLGEATRKVVVE
jgi:hypothetical protein